MLAEAVTQAFMGQWYTAAFSFAGGIGSLIAVASYFASRRELEEFKRNNRSTVEEIKHRVEKLEQAQTDMIKEISAAFKENTALQEKRSTAMHNRINPLTENTAAIKGQLEAFTASFTNFTQLIKAQSHQ